MNYNIFSKKDGITYGSCMDLCIDCVKEKKEIKRGDLEYKEVFKINNDGLEICYCMEHFKKKLGKYMLVDSSLIDNDDNDCCEEQTNGETDLLTNGSTNCGTIEETNGDEMVEPNDKPIDKPKKTTAKKTKKASTEE